MTLYLGIDVDATVKAQSFNNEYVLEGWKEDMKEGCLFISSPRERNVCKNVSKLIAEQIAAIPRVLRKQ